MPQSFRYVIVDVFTDTPLQGNQLAVFTDARDIPEDLLQPLALEIGFSETVFVYPPGYRSPSEQARAQTAGSPLADGHARIRIFTPSVELRFAGHPMLGTAFVLAQPLQLPEIRLETAGGTVPVRLERDGPKIAFGWMEQPIPSVEAFGDGRLLPALGVERSELPIELYDNGVRHVFVALPSQNDVARLQPDVATLATLGELGVSCFSGSGTRWKTRMFAPGLGVPEDPGTGSAAGPLAVHLARHGRIAWSDEIEVSQGVEIGRLSSLHARAIGSDEALERVEVGGTAVVVARGEFRL